MRTLRDLLAPAHPQVFADDDDLLDIFHPSTATQQ
jgi:hypothetical protein